MQEGIAKEAEDKQERLVGNGGQIHDEIPLFYSDIMPLLVSIPFNIINGIIMLLCLNISSLVLTSLLSIFINLVGK